MMRALLIGIALALCVAGLSVADDGGGPLVQHESAVVDCSGR